MNSPPQSRSQSSSPSLSPSPSRNQHSQNSLSTLSLSSALSWTLQRIASTPATTATNTKSTFKPDSMTRQRSSSLNRRSGSPYTPPPLPPLILNGYSSTTTTRLLTRALGEEIRILLPPRLQLCDTWNLCYNLEQHGVSLATLFNRSVEMGGAGVLVVKDSLGGLFGAFVNEPLRPSGRYYGTGECFLWKAMIMDDTNANTSSATSISERIRFKAFPYSGVNDYMLFCSNHYLSMGGGDGKYGLWLDEVFEKGVSHTCLTFGNEPLSECPGGKFDVISVELWSIGVDSTNISC